MAESPGGLVIAVGANIRALERQMKAAGAVAEKAADDIERRFRDVNPSISTSALSGALKGLGAAVAGVGLEKIARGVLEANREIAGFAQTSRQAGVELQRFQELRFAAGSKGISGKEFDGGLTGLAKALNEAKTEETELSKLFDANGLKLKDRQGTVISTNEALAHAADLISRASTEADKVEIADKFGLPKDFVPLLEGGAAALDQLAKNARDAGAVLHEDVVRRAADFDKAWNGAWNSFTTAAKAAAVEAATGLGGLINQALEFRQRMLNAAKIGAEMGALMGNVAQGREPPAAAPAGTPTTSPFPPSRPGRGYIGTDATKIPGKSSGGGGGGGKSEAEQRQEQVQRYIESLEKVNRVLEAEAATLGKSKAERAAAIELARIGTVTDEDQRAKIMQIVQANEALRSKIEEVKKSQKGLADAQRFFGETITDSLSDLIIDGAKAEDVMKRLVATLAKAALQAALLGQGPLAGIFGTSGANGGVGGLFGMLFKGFADGGYTGRGGRNEPIGVVHGGEYVFSKKAVQRLGLRNLEAMHRGFASGGPVGMSVPSVPPMSGKPAVNVNITNQAGAQVETRQESNGDISVLISAVEARIADNMLRGRGAMSAANTALRTNRHLR